jgi:hypothetical protein
VARKTSRPKARSGKGGKDPVTGLNAEIWGKKVYSDKVYDMTELGLAKDVIYEDGKGILSCEYEFGENAIALTVHTKGVLSVNGIPMSAKQNTSRYVYLGSFEYDGKKSLRSAVVSETAGWSHSYLREGGIGEYGDVDMSSPIGASTLLEVTEVWQKQQRVFDYLASPGTPPEGNIKSDFQKYQSSKYYENGWQDNPFATNLI